MGFDYSPVRVYWKYGPRWKALKFLFKWKFVHLQGLLKGTWRKDDQGFFEL